MLTSHYRRLDWHHWFEGAGLPSQSIEGDEFPSSILTYRAAQEGLGVAIGQPFLVAEEIAAGQLVPIFQPIERDLGLFVIWTRYANARVRGFIKWLAAEVERTDGGRPANVTEPLIEQA
ncbi:LysR substrate-binding domain-containing protein [Pseudorhizobium halotolerans]|uniref:LysR substrate-binding domain-containing protein n=1 Tax=Pseudorhizobium halotolerans TaxID=1233081 RepID=UPI003CC7D5EB